MENTKKKLVVYTCITNDYDTLREIPQRIFNSISDSVSFICFTDNPELYSDSKTWTIRELPEDLARLSKVKAQRVLKIVPFRYVDDISDISLWVDSNLSFTGNPLDLLSKCDLSKTPLWTFKHPQRNCIYDEELAVVRLKKEKLDIAAAQIEKYMKDRYPIKNGLAETNMILRRHDDPLMRKMSYLWAKEVIDGSHRDQLSFNYCCWKTGLKYGEFDKKVVDKIITRLAHKSPQTNNDTICVHENTDEEKKYDKNKENIVGVIITTHNRTSTAKATIKSLIDNIKFSGKLKWCLADDRSTGNHIEELLGVFRSNKIDNDDIFVCKTNEVCYGLGASLNNGLKKMFNFTDVVLTTEDDWFLQKELNIDNFVNDIKQNDIAQIRLGSVNYRPNNLIHFSYIKNYNKLLLDYRTSNQRLTINLQVCLRHKRCYDRLGYYDTNINSDIVERNFNKKYENYVRHNNYDKLMVLSPSQLKTNTLDCDENWFVHIGTSTIGHTQFEVPIRYRLIENNIDYRGFVFNHHSDVLNICLITDENYVIPTMTLIQSIHNNSGFKKIRKTNIYVLGVKLTKTSKMAFDILNSSLHKNSLVETNIIIKDVGDDIINKSLNLYNICHPNKHPVGSSTLIKFNICNILTEIDECLYIDTDIVCEKNLFNIQNFFHKKNEELMRKNKKSYVIGAVPFSNHHIKYTLNRQPMGTDITFARTKPYYFNAGILYLNLDILRKNNYTQKLFDTKLGIFKNNNTIKYDGKIVKCTGCDQDTFNYVFDSNRSEESCLILPFEFNVNAIEFPMEMPSLKLNYGNFELFKRLCLNDYVSLQESLNDGYLYHFTLNTLKPWKIKNYSKNKDIDRFIKLWWKEFETIEPSVLDALTIEQKSIVANS